jgi:hypothetical protein
LPIPEELDGREREIASLLASFDRVVARPLFETLFEVFDGAAFTPTIARDSAQSQ